MVRQSLESGGDRVGDGAACGEEMAAAGESGAGEEADTTVRFCV